MKAEHEDQWRADCDEWRGRLLTGKFAHWCCDWDGLPIDETCFEWPCPCADDLGATEAEKVRPDDGE